MVVAIKEYKSIHCVLSPEWFQNFIAAKIQVDSKLPASHVAHEVFCLPSHCQSYLTHLIFAHWYFDCNVLCRLVVCQSYFARGYLPACILPDGMLPVCTLHVSILPTEGKLHTGKLRLANQDWQNTYWQNTTGKTMAGKILHWQNTRVQYMANST